MCSSDGKAEIKILTLNCWGIPFVSSFRQERLHAISQELASGNYDIVSLQEIWLKSDYEQLQQNIKSVMPYSYYFYSGVAGSGLCVFSKGVIIDTLIYRYSLNGHPHRLLHGDWFAGKAAALCKILYHGFKINLYMTHTIARYDGIAGSEDTYYNHRLCQMIELAQFIRATQGWADSNGHPSEATILTGDLNLQPNELGLELILAMAHLNDAWAICNRENQCEPLISAESDSSIENITNSESKHLDIARSFTYLNADNTFCSKNHPTQGQRIDYIMFKETDPDVAINCLSCDVLCGKACSERNPRLKVSYSDHEAVLATFMLERKPSIDRSFVALNVKEENGDMVQILKRADTALEKATIKSRTDARWYRYAAAILSAILFATFCIDVYGNETPLSTLCRALVGVIISWCLWMGVIWHMVEINNIRNSGECIKLLLQRSKALNGKDH